MPDFGDQIRQEILIELQRAGAEIGPAITQELEAVLEKLREIRQAAQQGTATNDQTLESFRDWARSYKQLKRDEVDATKDAEQTKQAEVRQSQSTFDAAFRAHMQAMRDEDAEVRRSSQVQSDTLAERNRNRQQADKQVQASTKETLDAQKQAFDDEVRLAAQAVSRRKQLQADLTAALQAAAHAQMAGDKAAYDSAIASAAKAQESLDKFGQQATSKIGAWTRVAYLSMQGIEDLQYSFAAVANNIPMIAMSTAQAMGRSAEAAMGWAAGLSAIAIAFNQVVIPAFQSLYQTSDQFKGFIDGLNRELNPFHLQTYTGEMDKLKDRIKEINEKKVKLAVDDLELEAAEKRLRQLKEAQDAYNRGMEQRSDVEEKSGKIVGEVLKNVPGGQPALQQALRADMLKEIRAGATGRFADLQKQADEAGQQAAAAQQLIGRAGPAEFADPTYIPQLIARKFLALRQQNAAMEAMKKLDRDLQKDAERAVGNLIGDAGKGVPLAQQLLARRVRNAGVAGAPNLAGLDVAEQVAGARAQAQHEVVEMPQLAAQDREEKRDEAARKRAADAKKQADNARDAAAQKIAGVYVAKLRQEVEDIIAAGDVGQRAEADVRADVAGLFRQKMVAGGVPQEQIAVAVEHAADAGMLRGGAAVADAGGGAAIQAQRAQQQQQQQGQAANRVQRANDQAHVAMIRAQYLADDPNIPPDVAETMAKRAATLEDQGLPLQQAYIQSLNETNRRLFGFRQQAAAGGVGGLAQGRGFHNVGVGPPAAPGEVVVPPHVAAAVGAAPLVPFDPNVLPVPRVGIADMPRPAPGPRRVLNPLEERRIAAARGLAGRQVGGRNQDFMLRPRPITRRAMTRKAVGRRQYLQATGGGAMGQAVMAGMPGLVANQQQIATNEQQMMMQLQQLWAQVARINQELNRVNPRVNNPGRQAAANNLRIR